MTTTYIHPQGALFAARYRLNHAAAFADATNRAHNPWQAWQAIRDAEEMIAQAKAMLAVTLAERGIDPVTGVSAP